MRCAGVRAAARSLAAGARPVHARSVVRHPRAPPRGFDLAAGQKRLDESADPALVEPVERQPVLGGRNGRTNCASLEQSARERVEEPIDLASPVLALGSQPGIELGRIFEHQAVEQRTTAPRARLLQELQVT